MSAADDLTDLIPLFRDNWTATTVRYPNRKFDPPARDGGATTGYIEFSLRDTDGTAQITMGATQRRDAEVVHGIFVESRKNEEQLRTWAESIKTLWLARTMPTGFQIFPRGIPDFPVIFADPEINDEGWYGRELSTPYVRFIEP